MQIKRLCYNKDMGKKLRGGFTLIELALSLIFIAILSLTVVFLIQNISASYRRGLILNQVNTLGMDLVDDFRISIQNATSDPVTRMCEIYYHDEDPKNESTSRYKCIHDNARSFIMATKLGDIYEDDERIIESMPVYGALCTGTYTYVWNSGYFETEIEPNKEIKREVKDVINGNTLQPAVIGYRQSLNNGEIDYYSTPEQKYADFRLLKIYDDRRTICVNAMRDRNGNHSLAYNEYTPDVSSNIFAIDDGDAEAVELLRKNDMVDLVLYELYVAEPAFSVTRQNQFYAASFILGTRRGGIDIKATGNNCKPPSDNYSELEYCAINKFNFAVMAGGK